MKRKFPTKKKIYRKRTKQLYLQKSCNIYVIYLPTTKTYYLSFFLEGEATQHMCYIFADKIEYNLIFFFLGGGPWVTHGSLDPPIVLTARDCLPVTTYLLRESLEEN